jgi:hypothetical protein
MSGGGIHVWNEEALKHRPVSLPLAGVATEYVADKDLLIGTRLRVFINCIFHEYPELATQARGA